MSKNTHIEKAAKYKSDPDYESWVLSQDLLTEPRKSSFPAFKKFVTEQRDEDRKIKEELRATPRQRALQA